TRWAPGGPAGWTGCRAAGAAPAQRAATNADPATHAHAGRADGRWSDGPPDGRRTHGRRPHDGQRHAADDGAATHVGPTHVSSAASPDVRPALATLAADSAHVGPAAAADVGPAAATGQRVPALRRRAPHRWVQS